MTVGELDALPPDDAARALTACCGAASWVQAMVARRPFQSMTALLRAADDVWWSLTPDDWREAFAHHPRIGERSSAAPQSERARSWSAGEQASMSNADDITRALLARANRDYEHRFGFIYIVCAAGKSPAELLHIAQSRLTNEPATELHIAAEEQRKITRLRLEKLSSPEHAT